MSSRLLFICVLVFFPILLGCKSIQAVPGTHAADRGLTPPIPDFIRKGDNTIDRMDSYKTQYMEATSLELRRENRNAYVAAGLSLIDDAYFDYEKQFKFATSLKGGLVDSISITLSSVATLLTPGTTTRALSAADTTLKGVNKSVDQHFLREKTFELLNLEMRRQRSLVEQEIYSKINSDNDTTAVKYTLEDARRDLIRYYYAGSITNALTTLSQSVTESARLAESKAVSERKESASNE